MTREWHRKGLSIVAVLTVAFALGGCSSQRFILMPVAGGSLTPVYVESSPQFDGLGVLVLPGGDSLTVWLGEYESLVAANYWIRNMSDEPRKYAVGPAFVTSSAGQALRQLSADQAANLWLSQLKGSTPLYRPKKQVNVTASVNPATGTVTAVPKEEYANAYSALGAGLMEMAESSKVARIQKEAASIYNEGFAEDTIERRHVPLGPICRTPRSCVPGGQGERSEPLRQLPSYEKAPPCDPLLLHDL